MDKKIILIALLSCGFLVFLLLGGGLYYIYSRTPSSVPPPKETPSSVPPPKGTPSPVPTSYTLQDFVVYTDVGTDLPGQPMTGTVAQCQAACSASSSCVGFSRPKNSLENGPCWLKQNISNNRRIGDPSYYTYVKGVL
jgi:hypothetical protein